MPSNSARSSSAVLDEARQVRHDQDALVARSRARRPAPCGSPAAGTRACRGRTPCSACAGAISRFIHQSSEWRVALLRLDVDRLVVVLGVDDDRQVEPLRVGAREAGVAVARSTASACARRCGRRGRCCRPCRSRRRSRSTGVPGSENSRRSSARCVRRSLPSSGASRRRMPRLMRACGSAAYIAVHVVALLVGDHLQRQLVVVAQEHAPTGSSPGSPASAARMSRIGIAVLHAAAP